MINQIATYELDVPVALPHANGNGTHAASGWTFLSNYSHVLLLIAAHPETRMRDLAEQVGITERAVHRIVDELSHAGYVKIFKLGRRNRYEVQPEMRLRHPSEAHRNIGELIRFVQLGG